MIKIIDKLNDIIGKGVSWLTTVLVFVVCFDVFRRYLLRDSAAWVMELQWHLFALVFLLSAGYTLKHNKHVRVDLFYDNFNSRDKAWVNLVGAVLFLIPWCAVLMWVSWDYAVSSWSISEGSPDPGGLPARYLIKFSITAGFGLLLLQAVAMALRAFSELQEPRS